MKLTKEQVSNIYYMISAGFSQRSTARHLGHSKQTIARYIEPKVIVEKYRDLLWDFGENERNLYETNIEKSLWKTLAIFGAIGHLLSILIYLFL